MNDQLHRDGPERPVERRLRAALAARAEQVTVHDLRPAAPPSGQARGTLRTGRITLALAGLAAAAAVCLLFVLPNGPFHPDPAPPAQTPRPSPSPSSPVPTPTAEPSPSTSGSPIEPSPRSTPTASLPGAVLPSPTNGPRATQNPPPGSSPTARPGRPSLSPGPSTTPGGGSSPAARAANTPQPSSSAG